MCSRHSNELGDSHDQHWAGDCQCAWNGSAFGLTGVSLDEALGYGFVHCYRENERNPRRFEAFSVESGSRPGYNGRLSRGIWEIPSFPRSGPVPGRAFMRGQSVCGPSLCPCPRGRIDDPVCHALGFGHDARGGCGSCSAEPRGERDHPIDLDCRRACATSTLARGRYARPRSESPPDALRDPLDRWRCHGTYLGHDCLAAGIFRERWRTLSIQDKRGSRHGSGLRGRLDR